MRLHGYFRSSAAWHQRWSLPRLLAAEAACNALPAFAEATPDQQADAE